MDANERSRSWTFIGQPRVATSVDMCIGLRKEAGDQSLWEYPSIVDGVKITPFVLIRIIYLEAGINSSEFTFRGFMIVIVASYISSPTSTQNS
uniref:Uncharacterized protein At5g21110 n=1 Tax=Arabidopsis thaliana TaxID=3702 RepID=Q84VP6_ARATH|nr:hypothetical protein [Arabidopsis thaliana]